MQSKYRHCNFINRLIKNASDPSLSLQFLFPVLIEVLNARDIEGTSLLPEVMKPNPIQKPTKIIALNEKSEEVHSLLDTKRIGHSCTNYYHTHP